MKPQLDFSPFIDIDRPLSDLTRAVSLVHIYFFFVISPSTLTCQLCQLLLIASLRSDEWAGILLCSIQPGSVMRIVVNASLPDSAVINPLPQLINHRI